MRIGIIGDGAIARANEAAKRETELEARCQAAEEALASRNDSDRTAEVTALLQQEQATVQRLQDELDEVEAARDRAIARARDAAKLAP